MSNDKRDLTPDAIYHAYNRGNNKMNLFCDEDDFKFFISLVKYYKEIYKFEIYSICPMSNHFHLIIRDNGTNLSLIIGSIESAYASYFIKKYNYTGRVFEGRFKFTKILTDGMFLTEFQYVSKNPVSAHIEKNIFDYRWTFLTPASDIYNIINFEYVFDVFQKNCKMDYIEYLNSSVDDLWIDPIEVQRMEDKDALNVYRYLLHGMGLEEKDICYPTDNKKVIPFIGLCKLHGITLKQTEQFTGISKFKIRQMRKINDDSLKPHE